MGNTHYIDVWTLAIFTANQGFKTDKYNIDYHFQKFNFKSHTYFYTDLQP